MAKLYLNTKKLNENINIIQNHCLSYNVEPLIVTKFLPKFFIKYLNIQKNCDDDLNKLLNENSYLIKIPDKYDNFYNSTNVVITSKKHVCSRNINPLLLCYGKREGTKNPYDMIHYLLNYYNNNEIELGNHYGCIKDKISWKEIRKTENIKNYYNLKGLNLGGSNFLPLNKNKAKVMNKLRIGDAIYTGKLKYKNNLNLHKDVMFLEANILDIKKEINSYKIVLDIGLIHFNNIFPICSNLKLIYKNFKYSLWITKEKYKIYDKIYFFIDPESFYMSSNYLETKLID